MRCAITRVRAAKWLLPSTLFATAQLAVAQPNDTPTVEALWEIVQRQQQEIAELRQLVGDAELGVAETAARMDVTENELAATADYVETLAVDSTQRDTTIGGYGEMHYNNLSAQDPLRDKEEVDFHRYVMFFGHRFSDRVRFFSELELEHSLAGDGAPGEVELEQAFIDFSLSDTLTAKAGLFVVPIGIVNEIHEPPTFYGVERNDVENIIIPGTWWEAGAAIGGTLASGLSWDFAAHSGLAMPTTGSNAFRVRSGRQKVAEASASDPAYTARVRYTGIPGLELSASYQYQSDPSQVPGDGLDSGQLLSAHLIYSQGGFALRGLYGAWAFDGPAITLAADDEQSGWYVEPSYRLNPRWGVYARYENVEGARDIDEFEQWEAGFNYWPTPNVVIKFDYRDRNHDLPGLSGADFDGVDLGIGYQFF